MVLLILAHCFSISFTNQKYIYCPDNDNFYILDFNNTNDTTAGSTIDTTNLVSLNVVVTQGENSNTSS